MTEKESFHMGQLNNEESLLAFQRYVDDKQIGLNELNVARPWHDLPGKKQHVCKLKVGDAAPNSKVVKLDGTETTLHEILDGSGGSKIKNTPTVLVFGSMTCPSFRSMYVEEFCEMIAEHKGAVRLVFVYLAEAHPQDGWQVGQNVSQEVLINTHKSVEDRLAAAKQLLEHHSEIKELLVDSMEDSCDADFEAQPSRAYVIHDNQIVYQSNLGPYQISPSSLQAFLWEWPILKGEKSTNLFNHSISEIDEALFEE